MQRLNLLLKKHDFSEVASITPQVQMKLLEHLKLVSMTFNSKKSARAHPLRTQTRAPPADMRTLIAILNQNQIFDTQSEIGFHLMRSLTLLTRDPRNRKQLSSGDVSYLLTLLQMRHPRIRLDAANVLCNLCQDREKVCEVIKLAGVKPLLRIFRQEHESPDSRTAVAAALQSITYQIEGRKILLELDGLIAALRLLGTPYPYLRTRVVGIVRNLSVDPKAMALIRDAGIIPKLERLLHSRIEEEAGYAAGALQNLARDERSRKILLSLDVVPRLGKLVLTSSHVPAQIAAICALCNSLAPGIGAGFSGFTRKRLLKKVLSDALALGIIGSSLYGASGADSWSSSAIPVVEEALDDFRTAMYDNDDSGEGQPPDTVPRVEFRSGDGTEPSPSLPQPSEPLRVSSNVRSMSPFSNKAPLNSRIMRAGQLAPLRALSRTSSSAVENESKAHLEPSTHQK